MGEKIIVGPINKGLKTDRLPFVIDNDSFPVLINAYQWRGRLKRKRGTSLLCRLTRAFISSIPSYSSITTIILDGSGIGNILTGFSLQANGNIIPGTVSLTSSSTITYTDPTMDGFLTPTGTNGPNTIIYSTGVVTIPAEAGNTITATFFYYPNLPVMGLEDLSLIPTQFPGTLGFDTKYSYNIPTTFPSSPYDVSFYKNPAVDGINLPGYIPKTFWTPTTWNGNDYQQFWTVNYQGALWATNGIDVPFTGSKVGMQFAPAATITYVSNTATTLVLTITSCPLVIGDFVFVNEFTDANSATLNFQSGYVTAVAGNFASLTITITFPFANIGAGPYTPGIVQYLTNRSNSSIDCIRWYDGDPTTGNPNAPVFSLGKGWVNFMPPLSQGVYSIADLPARQYYLVGARMIVTFKDRLLFLGPVVQASTGAPIYLQDTVIFSQNGTPYYIASFTGLPTAANTVFFPILVPDNQTATAPAYFEDQTGFGGFISSALDQPLLTVSANEDALIMGFNTVQTRFVYTGNDLLPFNFYLINSELGSGSTFSVINMDQGVISRGSRGYIITNQTSAQRIDLEIPDQVFEINLLNNGTERVCAQRDYINEWIYFTYPYDTNDTIKYRFPTQTLQYNYRDNTWAIFYETYTTYGSFRIASGLTWLTSGKKYGTWQKWNEPWNSGSSNLEQPDIIAGNQQGFIMLRDQGTNEATSLTIQSFSGNLVTCPDHCLNDGDYILINGVIGTVGADVNGKIFQIYNPTTNTFFINPIISSGTYFGGGLIQRMYIPFIQSKQFPVAWGIGRKIRLGPQQYLLNSTPAGQIQLLIFLSENVLGDPFVAYNLGPIVPSSMVLNNSLIYGTILYTCVESTNLGLTPANINLQMQSVPSTGVTPQQQIWHRINTSLIGDTIQVGFTMSDDQMRDPTLSNQFEEIEIHGFILDVTPSQVLA